MLSGQFLMEIFRLLDRRKDWHLLKYYLVWMEESVIVIVELIPLPTTSERAECFGREKLFLSIFFQLFLWRLKPSFP